MPPIEDGDDVVVTIPDDELVDLVKGSGAAQADASGEPVNKREVKEPKARISPLARNRERDDDAEDRRKAEAIQRERDEARRLAEQAQARADALEARLAEESTARVAAEDNSRLREDQAMRAHWGSLESKKQQLEVAVAAQKAAAASAERDVIEATEKGDAVKLAAAQRAIARAEANLQAMEAGLVDADRRIEETRRLFSEHDQQRETLATQRQREIEARRARDAELAQRRQQEQAQRAPDPDAWIDTVAKQALGDDGAEWLRTNREFATDEKKNRAFLRFADQYADDHGKDALKSQEFLDALNERFAPVDQDEDEKTVRRQASRQADPDGDVERPRARVAAAPVSRGNQFFSSRNPNASQVKLPPKLARFVRDAGLDPTQYALGVVADIKAGKLPKNFLDPDYDHTV